MASEELRATIELMRSQPGIAADDMSLQEQRDAMEEGQSALQTPADVGITSVDLDGVPGRWIEAPGARADACIVYYHGGGYVMGSLDTHQELMSRLSRICQARVLGVDYRLAPEHLYPAAVEDGVKSYKWLLAQGVSPARIMLAGDSAGGGLVLATLLSLRQEQTALPAGGILFSPWTDLTGSGDSVESRAEADPMITGKVLGEIAATYCGETNRAEPLVSPVFADLAGLPPLLVQVGDAEILLDDATRLAANAEAAGVEVVYQAWDEAFHVFQAIPHLPEAAEALEQVGNFYKDRV